MSKHDQIEQDAIIDRRNKAWLLRVKAWNIREIADELHVSIGTIHSDLEAVRLEVCDDTKDSALRYREIELQRLDSWIKIAADKLSICTEASEIAPLSNSLKGLSERRAKLLGLDGPIQQVITAGAATPEMARLAIAEEFTTRVMSQEAESVQSESGEPGSTEDV